MMRPQDRPIFDALDDSEAAILTIYLEARGEPQEGKEAVAQVIANRAEQWGKTVKAVCYEPNQFSCYNEDDLQYPKAVETAGEMRTYLRENSSMLLCAAAWQGNRSRTATKIDSATFYKRGDVFSPWFQRQIQRGTLIETATVGRHDFFRERA